MKKAFAILMTLVLICSLMIPVFAADDTVYTIRFYEGVQGTIAGATGGVYTVTVPAGKYVSFDMGTVTENNSVKYYKMGIKESGEDNSVLHATSFQVTKDQDFVVAYGVRGDQVTYTIRYVDAATGAELAPPRTYTVNRGDKPIESYLHIEGYTPVYRNITGTIDQDGMVWTFEYNAIVTTTPTPTPTPTPAPTQAPAPTTDTTTVTTTETETTETGETATEPAAEPAAEAGTETEPFTPGTQTPVTVEETPETPADTEAGTQTEPEEILDLDTPLAEFEGSNAEGEAAGSGAEVEEPVNGGNEGGGVPVAAIVGGGIGGVALIAVIAALLVRRKKR